MIAEHLYCKIIVYLNFIIVSQMNHVNDHDDHVIVIMRTNRSYHVLLYACHRDVSLTLAQSKLMRSMFLVLGQFSRRKLDLALASWQLKTRYQSPLAIFSSSPPDGLPAKKDAHTQTNSQRLQRSRNNSGSPLLNNI